MFASATTAVTKHDCFITIKNLREAGGNRQMEETNDEAMNEAVQRKCQSVWHIGSRMRRITVTKRIVGLKVNGTALGG